MFRDTWIMVAAPATGFWYGVLLALFGFVAAGGGHGTYVVIGLSSAPFGLAQDVIIGLLAAPLLWLFIAFLAGGAKHWIPRICFVLAQSIHYVSLHWILNRPSKFADWDYVQRVGWFFWMAIGLYLAGQVALWALFGFQSWKAMGPSQDDQKT